MGVLKNFEPWQEDYFVLVQADNFASLLLAHGPLDSGTLEAGGDRATLALTPG